MNGIISIKCILFGSSTFIISSPIISQPLGFEQFYSVLEDIYNLKKYVLTMSVNLSSVLFFHISVPHYGWVYGIHQGLFQTANMINVMQMYNLKLLTSQSPIFIAVLLEFLFLNFIDNFLFQMAVMEEVHKQMGEIASKQNDKISELNAEIRKLKAMIVKHESR